MINKRAWKDVYNIPKNKYYLHTNPDNFMHRYQEALTSIDSAYDSLMIIMKDVLRDHIVYWRKLQKGLMNAAKEAGVFTGGDSAEFMRQYNEAYQATLKDSLSLTLYDFKKFANSFVYQQTELRKAKTPTEKKKRFLLYKKTMMEGLQGILGTMVYIYNSETRLNNKWAVFMGAEPVNMKKVMPRLAEAKKGIHQILKALGLDLVSGEPEIGKDITTFKDMFGVISSFENTIQPLNSDNKVVDTDLIAKFFTMATRQKIGDFVEGDSYGGGILKVLGGLLEDAHTEEIVASDYTSGTKSEVEEEFTKRNVGSRLHKDTVVDVVNFTYTVGTTVIKSGTSHKLTKAPGVLKKTYNVEDLVNTKYLKSKFKGDIPIPNDGKFLDIIKWVRGNMEALRNASVQKADSDFKEITARDAAIFQRQEKNLAALATLPRLLDGVYNYAATTVKLETTKEGIFWTAFINVRGTNIWVVDILELILESMGGGSGTSGMKNYFEVKGYTRNEIQSAPSEFWKLWKEKKGVLEELGDEVTYSKIYSSMKKSFKQMNTKAKLYESPYKSITMDLKLGNMKKKFGIK